MYSSEITTSFSFLAENMTIRKSKLFLKRITFVGNQKSGKPFAKRTFDSRLPNGLLTCFIAISSYRASKANFAEHYIFIIKKRLYLFLRSTGETHWEKYIQLICKNVNSIALDAIGGFSPASVTELTEYKVRLAMEKKGNFLDWHQQEENIKKFEDTPEAKRKINLGLYVYKTLEKEALGKSHDTQAGRLYIVEKILAAKDPIRYVLCGLTGKLIPGSYYREQLIVCPEKPDKDTFWLIRPQETYKERMFKGKKQVYVTYLFYPADEGLKESRIELQAFNCYIFYRTVDKQVGDCIGE
jgi:hypothetical protein